MRRFASRGQNCCHAYEPLCAFTGPPSRQVGFRLLLVLADATRGFMAFYYTCVPHLIIQTVNNPEPMTIDAPCEKLDSFSLKRLPLFPSRIFSGVFVNVSLPHRRLCDPLPRVHIRSGDVQHSHFVIDD